MGKKEPTELAKIIDRIKDKVGTKTKAEVDQYYRDIKASQQITQTTERIKKELVKHAPEQEQQIFSFLPTKMTRVSPFFPLSKRDMKDRPLEELTWESSWGRLTVSGKRLSIYDESVLLAVLLLMRKHKTGTFQTTRYEICGVMNVKPAKDTYNAVWESLKRLTKTGIDLEIWEGKGKKRKTKIEMTTTILSGAVHTEKYQITVNPYFLEMYGEGFLTNLDLRFRASLTGDITKALYRFYEGQRDTTYQCHVLTLSKAVNLNMNLSNNDLRKHIRKGLRELRTKGYFKRWSISKSDIVSVWRAAKIALK